MAFVPGREQMSHRRCWVAEAKAIVESAQEFDLLFTDLTIGDEHDGGIEVANLLAHVRPEIPVVYTSGRELTDGLKALFVENSHFLAKPYTDTQMGYCFGRMLETRCPKEKS
jgi:CheY-like chemotaxis protein